MPQQQRRSTNHRIKEQSGKWADNLTNLTLGKNTVWLAINSRIMKSLEWPLTAITLTKTQCTRIMHPIVTAGLKASGAPTHMDRKIVYGPAHLMGLAVKDLYTTQGISHIRHLLNHGHKHTITGQLMRATYKQLATELGLPGNIFDWKFEDWEKVATQSWVKHTWK